MIKFIAVFALISGVISTPIELDPSNEYLVDSTYYSDATDIRDPASPYNSDLAYLLEEELALLKDEEIVSYDTLTERQERETADTRIQLGGTFGQNDIFGNGDGGNGNRRQQGAQLGVNQGAQIGGQSRGPGRSSLGGGQQLGGQRGQLGGQSRGQGSSFGAGAQQGGQGSFQRSSIGNNAGGATQGGQTSFGSYSAPQRSYQPSYGYSAPQPSYQRSSFGGSGSQGGQPGQGQPGQGQQGQGPQGGGDLPAAIGLISQIEPNFQGILYIDVQGGQAGMQQMGGAGAPQQPQGGNQSPSYGGNRASQGGFGQPQGGQGQGGQGQGPQGSGQQGQGPQGGGGDLPAAIGLIGQLQPNFQGILYIDVAGGPPAGPPGGQQGGQQGRQTSQQYFGGY